MIFFFPILTNLIKVLKLLQCFCIGFFFPLVCIKTTQSKIAQDISFWSSIYLHKQITVSAIMCHIKRIFF